MWDGDIGPNQIIEGLQCQVAELKLYPVGGEKPWNDILKGGKIIRSVLGKDTLASMWSVE